MLAESEQTRRDDFCALGAQSGKIFEGWKQSSSSEKRSAECAEREAGCLLKEIASYGNKRLKQLSEANKLNSVVMREV